MNQIGASSPEQVGIPTYLSQVIFLNSFICSLFSLPAVMKNCGQFSSRFFFFCFNLKAPDKSWNSAKSRRSVLIPTLTRSWNKNEGLVVTAERKLKISDLEFTNKLRIWRASDRCTCFTLPSVSCSRRCQSHWPCQICWRKEQLEFALHVDCRNLPTVWARVFLENLTAAQLVNPVSCDVTSSFLSWEWLMRFVRHFQWELQRIAAGHCAWE